ncbi:MAG: hypothetical protein PWP31_1690 [Clostridia bacterium]|nr:hypothetical protein [Clostridia bacterium]MDK2901722.1 hypothetical protein [Thermosediminibacterales bacterium]
MIDLRKDFIYTHKIPYRFHAGLWGKEGKGFLYEHFAGV